MVSSIYRHNWEAKHGRNYSVAHKCGAKSKSRKKSQSRYAYRKSLGTKRGFAYEHIVEFKMVALYGY